MPIKCGMIALGVSTWFGYLFYIQLLDYLVSFSAYDVPAKYFFGMFFYTLLYSIAIVPPSIWFTQWLLRDSTKNRQNLIRATKWQFIVAVISAAFYCLTQIADPDLDTGKLLGSELIEHSITIIFSFYFYTVTQRFASKNAPTLV